MTGQKLNRAAKGDVARACFGSVGTTWVPLRRQVVESRHEAVVKPRRQCGGARLGCAIQRLAPPCYLHHPRAAWMARMDTCPDCVNVATPSRVSNRRSADVFTPERGSPFEFETRGGLTQRSRTWGQKLLWDAPGGAGAAQPAALELNVRRPEAGKAAKSVQ